MVFISGMVPNSAPLKKDKPFKLAPNSRHVCLNIGELARPCVSWIKDSCLELLYPRLWEGPQSVCVCVHELVWNWPPPSPKLLRGFHFDIYGFMFHFSVSHGTVAAHAGFNVYAGMWRSWRQRLSQRVATCCTCRSNAANHREFQINIFR